MADEQNNMAKTLDMFSGKRAGSAAGSPPITSSEERFAADFETLKKSVIRPAFENIGSMLEQRGHEIHISEDPNGKIAIHIVPAGVDKTIHPFDWFPTFSVFGAPFTGSVGMHGRNMRPNSEATSGSRGDYKLAQVDRSVVEKALMKFIGEIANW